MDAILTVSPSDPVKCDKDFSDVGKLGSEDLLLLVASKQKKVRAKVVKSGVAEDDFDDNASICSSLSSASEHSIKNLKRIKKVKRPPCEVHPKSADKTVDGETKKCSSPMDNKLQNETAKDQDDFIGSGICTCRKSVKSEKRSRDKSRAKRPEPEGGLLTGPFKGHILDEFERVVYSDEPLFSDVEEDPVVDEQIRMESERFHKRIGNADGENIFSAIQMLNTNTMIKFAILQTELKNIKDVSIKRAEVDMNSMTSRLESINENFENAEHSFKSIGELLQQTSKVVRAMCRNDSIPHLKSAADKTPTAPSSEALLSSESFQSHFKQSVCDVDLELAETRLESMEIKVLDLEEELKIVTIRYKSESEEVARRLKSRLHQAQNNVTEAEKIVLRIKMELERKIR